MLPDCQCDEKDHHSESHQSLLLHPQTPTPEQDAAKKWPACKHTEPRFIISLTVNFLLAVVVCALVAGPFAANEVSISASDKLRAISLYSPIFDKMKLRLVTEKLNGNLWDGGGLPWYGAIGDQEKEAVWDDLEFIRMIPITSADIVQMGKDPAKVAKFEDSYWHMGNDSYVATLDIFHQIHCLNLIRKAAFGSCPNKDIPTKEKDKIESAHLMHCTSMLMQHLLCTGDTGMLTYRWVHENDFPFPDFAVNRKCKDWRQFTEYRDKFSIDSDMYLNYTKQKAHINL